MNTEEEKISFIKKLSDVHGPSGFEDSVTAVIRNHSIRNISYSEDTFRNLYLRRRCSGGGRLVVQLDAHSDEVGLMVHSIQASGLLNIVPLGGWVLDAMQAHLFNIVNKTGTFVPGVISSVPPHFMEPGEGRREITFETMTLDVGASSREEVLHDYGILPGAVATPAVKFHYNSRTGIMMGKAFDCRLGCAAVINVLESLSENEGLAVDLVGTISSQEEIGTRGVQIAAGIVQPDIAIVFEGTPADDTVFDKYSAQAILKKGPQIRLMDSSMIANPRFATHACKVAEEAGIEYQVAVRRRGMNNGGRIALSGAGVPTITIGIPVRYVHTHHGMSSFADYENSVEWCVEILKSLNNQVVAEF